MSTVPIAEGLFTWPSESPRLIGSRCRSCGATTFPQQASCPRCTGDDVDQHLLSPRGTLWTYTVQAFEPKEPYAGPQPFEPYGVGYVELPGEVLVEARLTENDPEVLRIGDDMELVTIPFGHDDEGREVVTFAFRPAASGSAS